MSLRTRGRSGAFQISLLSNCNLAMKLLRYTLTLLLITVSVAAYSQEAITHVVAKGETVTTICSKYGVSEEDLFKENPALKNYIYVGMKIRIPASASVKVEDKSRLDTRKEKGTEESPRVSYQEKKTVPDKPSISSKTVEETSPRTVAESPSLLEIAHYDRDSRWLMAGKFGYNIYPKDKGAWSMSFSVGAGYYLGKLFLVEGLIGYNSVNTSSNVAGYKTKSHSSILVLNQNIHALFPIVNFLGVGAYMGPEEQLFMAGKTTVDEKTYKIEPSERFTLLYDIGARVYIWSFYLGAEYKIGLTKNSGAHWGITFGFLSNF